MKALHILAAPFLWAREHKGLRSFFLGLDAVIATINKNIAVFGLLIGVIIVAVNVFLRCVASFYPSIHSLSWGEEVSGYCFIWSALFGAAYGFRKGVHISVMMLVEKFPAPLAKASVLFSHVLSACFLAFMAWAGWLTCELYYDLGRYSEALHDVPLWIFLLCLPLAFIAATYRVCEKIWEVSFLPADEVAKSTQEEIIHDSVSKE